jgi:hypothetical protein
MRATRDLVLAPPPFTGEVAQRSCDGGDGDTAGLFQDLASSEFVAAPSTAYRRSPSPASRGRFQPQMWSM